MASTPQPSRLEDFLKCPICLETYRQPRCLPCLHSFCHSCLHTFISSQRKDNREQTGFPCPVCRTFTSMSKDIDQEKWSEQLPLNHFIESYLDVFLLEKNEKLCDSCSDRNEEKKATSWCTNCSEAFCDNCCSWHKSFKMSRQHIVIDISVIGDQKVRAKADINCPQHTTETVRIYCNDHRVPCCHTCATINHRKCEDVVSIEEASKDFRKSTEMLKLTKSLSTKSDALAELLEERSSNVKAFQEQARQIEKELTSFRTKLNSHLDVMEKKVREELSAAEKNFTCDTEINETDITGLKRALDNCKAVLETSTEHGSDVQCLVEYNRVKEQVENFGNLVENKCRSFRTFHISFRLGEDVQNILKISYFGDISVQENRVNVTSSHVSCSLAREGVIISKHKYSNTSGGTIAGVFAHNKVVIAEYSAKQITTLDLNASVLDSMTLDENPRTVTLIDDITEIVAVSLPSKKCVTVISLKSLSVLRSIQLDIDCFGIDFHSDILAVTRSSGKRISLFDFKSGKQRLSVPTSETWFVKLRNKGKYIFTQNENTLMSGNEYKINKVCKCSKLSYGRGIDCDVFGNIYVVGLSSRNICQISPEGQFIRAVSTNSLGLRGDPWSIAFKPDSLECLVTSYTGELILCKIMSADVK